MVERVLRPASLSFLSFSFSFALLVVSCSPQATAPPALATPPLPQRHPAAAAAAPAAAPIAEAPAPAPTPSPSQPARTPRVFRESRQGISFTGVAFDSRSHRLKVADQPGGPGSQWAGAREAAGAMGGIAAVNAGFFTPQGAPLGLVIAGGQRRGSPNRASSLGAGYFADGGSPALLRREQGPGNASEALQSGPFLVERGRTVAGLSTTASTARTFLAYDGGTRWILVRTGACSLAELGQALGGGALGGVEIVTALNLDGGRSSDLWISSAVQEGPVQERPFWNKPVRNFLVLVPRG